MEVVIVREPVHRLRGNSNSSIFGGWMSNPTLSQRPCTRVRMPSPTHLVTTSSRNLSIPF